MKCWGIVGVVLLAALGLAVPGWSQDKGDPKGPAKWEPITVTFHGHSFFVLQSSKGTRVAIDPHAIPEYGRNPGMKADVILISHNHNDHNRAEVIENAKTAKLIRGLKGTGLKSDWNIVEETVKDVTIRTVGLYHDEIQGMRSGKVGAFVIEMDGWKICHLGDLGHELTPAQIKRIGTLDVLFVPVGGIYTLNGSEAKRVVNQLRPKEYIFPMHFGTKQFDAILPIREFLDDQDRDKVAISDDNKIVLNRDRVRPRPLIVQLNYMEKGRKEKE